MSWDELWKAFQVGQVFYFRHPCLSLSPPLSTLTAGFTTARLSGPSLVLPDQPSWKAEFLRIQRDSIRLTQFPSAPKTLPSSSLGIPSPAQMPASGPFALAVLSAWNVLPPAHLITNHSPMVPLVQSFSDFTKPRNRLNALLKCRFWFNRSQVGGKTVILITSQPVLLGCGPHSEEQTYWLSGKKRVEGVVLRDKETWIWMQSLSGKYLPLCRGNITHFMEVIFWL